MLEINNNLKEKIVNQKDNSIKIQGTLTSQVQLRGEGTQEPYYYAFVRLKKQKVDLPVIFKVKDDQGNLTKPKLKKTDECELTGHYSNSPHSIRKSFTAYDYVKLAKFKQCLGCQDKFISESYDYCAICPMPKKCLGCQDKFTCFTNEDYDYCSACEINGSRYINKASNCSECDGKGIIKFPNQRPRNCKLCYLANQEQREENNFAK